MANPTVAIIGAGKVGSALALLLQEKGYVIQSIASKSNLSALQLAQATKARVCQTPAEAVTGVQMVLITTPDAVSYTHLDVYKRQVWILIPPESNLNGLLISVRKLCVILSLV